MFKFCPNCGSSEIKDIGDSTLTCPQCKKHHYINSYPTASVIPIVGSEVLLCIRAEDPEKGKLDLIGGFLKNGEDPVVGAVREFEEETGYKINGQDLKYLGIWVGDYVYQGTNYKTFNVIYTIDFSKDIKLTANDDVGELVWLPIDGKHEYAFTTIYPIIEELKKTR